MKHFLFSLLEDFTDIKTISVWLFTQNFKILVCVCVCENFLNAYLFIHLLLIFVSLGKGPWSWALLWFSFGIWNSSVEMTRWLGCSLKEPLFLITEEMGMGCSLIAHLTSPSQFLTIRNNAKFVELSLRLNLAGSWQSYNIYFPAIPFCNENKTQQTNQH